MVDTFRNTEKTTKKKGSPSGSNRQMAHHDISDAVWQLIEPHVPARSRDGRALVNAVLWLLRDSKNRWADLPVEYGTPVNLCRKFYQWRKAGLWENKLYKILSGIPDYAWLVTRADYFLAGHSVNRRPVKNNLGDWLLRHHEEKLLRCYEGGGNPKPADEIGASVAALCHWKCPDCGHEWDLSPNKATRRNKDGSLTNCPACQGKVLTPGNNLGIQFPELAAQWDAARNEDTPSDHKITSKAHRYWKCNKCRNRWEAVVRDRVKAAKGARAKGKTDVCPYCTREKVSPTYNLAVMFPHIARDWDYENNGGRTPYDCPPFGSDIIAWRCRFNPSHRWKDRIGNRTLLQRGCKACSNMWKITYISRAAYYYLLQLFPDCACEYEFPPKSDEYRRKRGESRYWIDIALPFEKIAIEHFGYSHQRPASIVRDQKKIQLLEAHGWKIIRIVEGQGGAPVRLAGDILHYNDAPPYKHLDQLMGFLISRIEAVLGEPLHGSVMPNHIQDYAQIDDLYFNERKKRTLAIKYPEVAQSWSKNNPCQADEVAAKAGAKYKWICPDCGEEFEASVYSRTHLGIKNHVSCPCLRKKKNAP